LQESDPLLTNHPFEIYPYENDGLELHFPVLDAVDPTCNWFCMMVVKYSDLHAAT
jgi:hypothetical protein